MIEFTDLNGILHVIPIREVRRLSFGETSAIVHLKDVRFDVQISVALYVGQDIRKKLNNTHIEG